MIVGDYGLCLADYGNERGLSDVREAEQTDIGKQLELEYDLPLLAGSAAFCETGSLAGRGLEWVLPQPPRPPFAATNEVFSDISAITAFDSASRIIVPRGILMTRSSPFLPRLRPPSPRFPSGALYFLL